MGEKFSKNEIERINQEVDIYKIEVSNFVIFEMNETLLEEVQKQMKLKNISQATKSLKKIELRLEKNIKRIKGFLPKKEPVFLKNFILVVVITIVLFVLVYLISGLFGGGTDWQTDFVRWASNISFCGACILPPVFFLWMVVFPRLFNDVKRNELEISLVHDLARIVVIRNFLEEESK